MGEMLGLPDNGSRVRYYRLPGNKVGEVGHDLESIGVPIFDAGVDMGHSGGTDSERYQADHLVGEIVIIGEELGRYEKRRARKLGAPMIEIPPDQSFMLDYIIHGRVTDQIAKEL